MISPEGATAPSQRADLVGLVRSLCDALEERGVSYCHWKSNESIERSERAESDLDLLVDARHAARFEQTLRELGFRRGMPRTGQPPGLFHAYGLDEESGRLVHIHAHYRMVVGDDMTKNYRLPIEEAYLASARRGRVFRVPAPEFEYVVFVLRMVLKHATWDALLTGHGSLSAGEARELEYLSRAADAGRATAVVREHLPLVAPELWERCVRAVRGRAPLPSRIRTGHRLEHALSAQARRSPAVDPFVRTWRRSERALRRRLLRRRPVRSRLDGGGALVAIVGGDGAGKSTAVDEIVRWLSRDLDVVAMHLGKPPGSATSTLVGAAWRRTLGGSDDAEEAARTPRPLSDDEPMNLRRLAKVTRKVMVSRDRYLAYVRARRLAAEGAIVVCDRFPLPEITRMDGPATAQIPRTRERNRAVGLLARIEERYYARIDHPDVLIVLRVHPDVAVARRHGTESEDFVRHRAEEIWQLGWGDVPAVVIDAGRPKDEVLAEIRSAIWARL